MALKEKKTKSFTFRITPSLAKEMQETNAKLNTLGMSYNFTEDMTKALEKALKNAHTEIKKVDAKWEEKQQNIDLNQHDGDYM